MVFYRKRQTFQIFLGKLSLKVFYRFLLISGYQGIPIEPVIRAQMAANVL